MFILCNKYFFEIMVLDNEFFQYGIWINDFVFKS